MAAHSTESLAGQAISTSSGEQYVCECCDRNSASWAVTFDDRSQTLLCNSCLEDLDDVDATGIELPRQLEWLG